MDNNIQLLILKIIKFSGDINPLIKMGYEYAQIANLIKNEIDSGHAERHSGELVITAKGNIKIEELNKGFKRKDASVWIEPEHESKISRISVDDIYLPNQEDLSF
jgi:hypothetical protein